MSKLFRESVVVMWLTIGLASAFTTALIMGNANHHPAMVLGGAFVSFIGSLPVAYAVITTPIALIRIGERFGRFGSDKNNGGA